ncbi:MAG: CaiB/BaiF CoA-transferase family protein [Steroidobacteraceae bacterium]
MSAPLAGLRIIELARVLAGPWAGQLLADLGADVVKVEAPAGDDTRRWGPPFLEYAEGGRDAAYYHACNRGKRSVVADFRTPEGRALARDLCLGADVVIENFRRGDLARHGLDAVTLRAAQPSLIYCSITGFGHDGPYADLSGYDFIVQGMGGSMDLTGEPDGEPQKAGVAYADLFAGMYAVAAVQAALLQRARTGQGATIDLALLDTQVSVLSYQALSYLVSGQAPRRMGNAHPNLVPYQVFRVQDGELIIAVGNDRQFRHLVEELGLPGLADDPVAHTNEDRVRNRDQVVALLQQACLAFRRAELVERLRSRGVPVGPINTVAEVFADPQVQSRGMAATTRDAQGRSMPGVNQPLRLDGQRPMAGRTAPRLGEHQAEIEREVRAWRLRRAGGANANPPQLT